MRNHFVNVHLYRAQYFALQVFVCIATILVLLFPPSSLAENGRSLKKYNLNIQEQDLSAALIELGYTLGLSIIIPEAATPSGKACLAGKYTVRQALAALLEGSGFTFRQLGRRIYLIEALPEDAQAPPLEELTTVGYQTGTRIFRSANRFNGPLDQINALELERAGTQSLSDLIQFIPAVSGNSTSTSISNGGDGTTKVTLRGLPANNTLVLLNGQRISFDGLAGDSVDLNAISPLIINQIDIYKDGASAIYGSEAIAGVINIATKRQFDGLKVSQYLGQTYDGHALTSSTDVLLGSKAERFSVLAAFSYFSQEGMFGPDRELTASADGRSRGGVDGRSSATVNSRINLGEGGSVILRDGVTTQRPGIDDYRPITEEDLFDFNPLKSTISPSSRLSAYSFVSAEISDNIRWHGQFIATSTEATITLAPTPLSTVSSGTLVTVSKDNIYNPFGVDLQDVRRRVIELPARTQRNAADTFHVNSGLLVEQGLNTWRLSAYWNRVDAEEEKLHLVDGNRVIRATGPSENCLGIDIDGCEPLNLFGPAGSITPRQLDYIRAKNLKVGQSELVGLNVDLSGSAIGLRGLQFSYAGGAEIRQESSWLSNIEGSSDILGSDFDSNTRGERSVYETYGELLVPVKLAKGWGNLLEIELAARMGRSSDYGSNVSPKLGLRYELNRDIALRGTYSEGYRAPSIRELYRDGSVSFTRLVDPCASEGAVDDFEGCTQRSDDSLTQFPTEFRGDRNLKPEISKNYTLGLLFTPREFSGVTFGVDYFDIRLNNIIDSNPQTLLDQNAISGLYDELITRNSDGNITNIQAPFINIGERRVRGLDFSLLYSRQALRWSINASHLIEFEERLNELSEAEDLAGTFRDAAREGNGTLPKWKANMGVSWLAKHFELNYSLNYIDKLSETYRVGREDRQRFIDPWLTHNIQLQKPFSSYDVSIGVDNFLNRSPPFSASAFNSNFDARAYDIKGRYFYIKVGKQF